ncbi:MAG: acylphosphatase [Dehalococcoidia bacterium]|nr:acylphosphatase [Dehalococcoidia bacterium]MDW8120430.1 acylphosphatase [Chloroflexota bacterium]
MSGTHGKDQQALHATVYGRVQGVGFRAFVEARARTLGLKGWVRNLPNGQAVEVWAEGPAEALALLREALHRGPPLAQVERVEEEWKDPTGLWTGFTVRYGGDT